MQVMTTNWPASTIVDRESDKSTRWIKEAVHIRKEGRRSKNRGEISYTLSHTYDRFLTMSHHHRPCQEPEAELNKLLLTKVSHRDRNVKINNVRLSYAVIYIHKCFIKLKNTFITTLFIFGSINDVPRRSVAITRSKAIQFIEHISSSL